MRTVTQLLVLALILIAGCTSSTPNKITNPATSDAHGTPPPTDQPPPPIIPTSSGFTTLQLQECEETSVAVETPRDDVEAVVPDVFNVAGGFTSSTATILFMILDCHRGVNDTQTFDESIRLMHAIAFVTAKNASWSVGQNFYILDTPTNHSIVKDYLVAHNSTSTISTLSTQSTTLPGGTRQWDWTIDAPNYDTSANCVMPGGGTPRAYTFATRMWTGTGPYHRTSFGINATAGFRAIAGTLEIAGAGNVVQALGGDSTHALRGDLFANGTYSYADDGTFN